MLALLRPFENLGMPVEGTTARWLVVCGEWCGGKKIRMYCQMPLVVVAC